jgi:ATP-dependent Clp protease ATP-binding subunit ClpC
MMRLDRFTERAQDAAQRAVEIMTRYGHTQIDVEHLLLALLEQPEGVIPQILERLGVDVDVVQQRLDDVLKDSPKAGVYGSGGVGQVFITPRVKRVLDLANDEANRLKDDYISTEHLFLAITNERNTPVARILRESGVTKGRIYDAIKDGWDSGAGAAVHRLRSRRYGDRVDLSEPLLPPRGKNDQYGNGGALRGSGGENA